MTRTTELTPLAQKPQPGRLGREEQVDYASFLEIIRSDAVNRLAHRRVELRLHNAGFKETCCWKTSTGRIVSDQMLLNFSPTRSPRIQPRNARYLAIVVRKTRHNASMAPIAHLYFRRPPLIETRLASPKGHYVNHSVRRFLPPARWRFSPTRFDPP